MVEHELLARAYSIRTRDDSQSVYRDWAESYDETVRGRLGYVAPAVTAARFAEHFADTGAPVADLGCGTGLSGLALRQHGFAILDGYDLSEDMLAQARAKGIYRRVATADLTHPLPAEPASYGGAVAVGVFSHGFLWPHHIAGLLRIIRPGGVFTFTVNEQVFAERDYAGALDRLAGDGIATLLDLGTAPYLEAEAIGCHIASLRVAAG